MIWSLTDIYKYTYWLAALGTDVDSSY